MAHLFSKIVLQDALKNISLPNIEDKLSILTEWNEMYQKGELQKKKETAFEASYSEKLFGTILGYADVSSGIYTREKHPKNISNGQTCDIGLGYYSSTTGTEKNETQAVIELKDAGTSIDRPQQREGNMTPIQQGFKYKPLYNSRWVIVSNYYEIRLYRDTYQDYEVWTLADLVNPANDYEKFRIFYLLLRADSLIVEHGESHTEKLLAKVRIEQETITKKFYKEYADLRKRLMRDIWANNLSMQNVRVIAKTQRIIDRLVFIYFCEDNKGLLPPNRLVENITQAKSIGFSVWDTIKMYFRSIAEGNNSQGIPHYNGGLFKEDVEIDSLKISDDLCQEFANLGRYDFSEDGGQLSVEILGHIFEQSISDLEEIRTQIQNAKTETKGDEKQISKRKKDGIFYTPSYIVDYIVRNSLGKYLEEHEERLKEKYKLKGDITEKTYRKREIEAYTEYQHILHNVKVLDPACGSGAFLVRVFDFLFSENKRARDIIYDEIGTQLKVGDDDSTYRAILKNNIYGVDLNEESVEITRLSLWLKTLQKGEKLQTLDNNIKCGNSLIDDPAVAGDKAFNWNTEFADILASGGFDVIVGNPPYVKFQYLKDFDSRGAEYLVKNYETTKKGNFDLYIPFFERSFFLLKDGGELSFIAPSVWRFNDYGKPLINFILKNRSLSAFVDFGSFQVFEGATTYTAIQSFTKTQNTSIKYISAKKGFSDAIYPSDIPYRELSEDFFSLISEQERMLMKKMDSVSLKLGDISDKIFVGVQSSADDVYHLQKNESLFYSKSLKKDIELDLKYVRKIISGESIKRYQIKEKDSFIVFPYIFENGIKLLTHTEFERTSPKTFFYLKENESVLRKREKGKFDCQDWYQFGRNQNLDKQHFPKLTVGRLVSRLQVALDSNGDYVLDNVDVNGIFPKPDWDIKYLLSILNSRACNFYFIRISKPFNSDTYSANKQFLSPLPIPNISLSEQQPFIGKADAMLSLNRDIQEKSSSFLKNIQAKYNVSKITRKLEKWWELDFAEFLKETKISISLTEQEELMTYFETRRAEVRAIDAEIRKTDAEIDTMVFDLYGLTEEERGVVLGS